MKMIHGWGAAFMLLVASHLCYGQESYKGVRCVSAKNKLAAKVTVVDAAEENYDVKYVKLNVSLSNASTAISGDAITKARTLTTMPAYVFELVAPLVIDSVLIDGVLRPFTTAGDAHTVTFASPMAAGTLFTAQVFYHGTPTTGSGPFAGTNGLNSMVSPSWGTRATFSLSESYHAKEWWPCKQSLNDKIDSSDVWITVADTLKAGSNGLLKAITPIDATHVRYEWKERYPIDYYLISVAVAPYVDYSYYMHFTGSTDSMLVQNYVYNNPGTLPAFKSVIDSTGMMIDYLSALYGRYPFWQEKYGHCMARLSGGMEHQTMTTLGYFDGTLVVHELGHQWFGDNVTCATWADIAMNEGFAAYTEYLFIDHFRNYTQARNDMRDRHDNVKSISTGTVYVDDTTSEGRIFDSRLTYDKGACVLHMLRFVVNNDSLFFQVYKNWQQNRRGTTGTISEFRNEAKALLGTTVNSINLDTFFNQWMYLEGYPVYNVSWNQIGTDVYVQLDQTTAVPTSVSLFKTPVEITLHAATMDTVVRVVNDQASQVFHFTWDKTMTSTYIDPNLWLIDSVESVNHNLSLGISNQQMPLVKITPNPATAGWNVANVAANSTLTLMDISGRSIWQAANGAAATMTVPAQQLASGIYLLRIVSGQGEMRAYKLVKE